jgi:hypothetical protein
VGVQDSHQEPPKPIGYANCHSVALVIRFVTLSEGQTLNISFEAALTTSGERPDPRVSLSRESEYERGIISRKCRDVSSRLAECCGRRAGRGRQRECPAVSDPASSGCSSADITASTGVPTCLHGCRERGLAVLRWGAEPSSHRCRAGCCRLRRADIRRHPRQQPGKLCDVAERIPAWRYPHPPTQSNPDFVNEVQQLLTVINNGRALSRPVLLLGNGC